MGDKGAGEATRGRGAQFKWKVKELAPTEEMPVKAAKEAPVKESKNRLKKEAKKPKESLKEDSPKAGKGVKGGSSSGRKTKKVIPKGGSKGNDTPGGGKGGGSKNGLKALWKGKGEDNSFADCKLSGAKTLQEVEDEIEREARRNRSESAPVRRPRGPDDPSKQPLEAKGDRCEVRKHSGMGCAVVSMDSEVARNAVLAYAERGKAPGARPGEFAKVNIDGITAQLRPHRDKATGQDVKTDIFMAWGHRVEKTSPLEAQVIADEIDSLLEKAQPPTPPVNSAVDRAQMPAQVTAGPGLDSSMPVQHQYRPMGPSPPSVQAPSMGQPVSPATVWPTTQNNMSYPYNFMSPPYQTNPQAPATNTAAATMAAQNAAMQRQLMAAAQMQFFQQMQVNATAGYGQMHQPPVQWPNQQATLQTPMATQALPPSALPSSALPSGALPSGGLSADAKVFLPSSPAHKPQSSEVGNTPPPGGLTSESMSKKKKLRIVDPGSGISLETLQLHFQPSEPRKPLVITDPANGQAIQMTSGHRI